jgi:hypothetical protein
MEERDEVSNEVGTAVVSKPSDIDEKLQKLVSRLGGLQYDRDAHTENYYKMMSRADEEIADVKAQIKALLQAKSG